MKRKEREDVDETQSTAPNAEDTADETKKPRKEESASSLHETVMRELRRLGVQTTTAATDASASSSSSGESKLAPAFLELNSFTFPTTLFTSEAWDLRDVELRNWWAPSTRGERPTVEIGSAKRSETYVYLALPTDTADPSQPVVFIRQKDGRDEPIGSDAEGIPFAEFLASLQAPEAEDENDDAEDDDDDDGDDDPYSGFISAIVAGEELPSEDEDDADHDADQDDDEDADFEVEDEGDE